jgi:hypothetical protein
MMHDFTDGGMMWGTGFYGLLGILVTALLIGALVKYLFFR